MVGVSGIPLYYVMCCDMPAGWTAVNKHDCLKYKSIYIGLAWEAEKMAVYTEVKSCCLDSEGWSWIKVYNLQKYGQQATANLCEHYGGASELNKALAWETSNVDNSHFTNEHTYWFENFSTILQYSFIILNNNGKNHSENQMVRKIL